MSEEDKDVKKCFVVTPIGADNSATRRAAGAHAVLHIARRSTLDAPPIYT